MYLNLVQLAESLGVSERTVEDWIRHDGLPHTPDRGRLVFDRAQVAQWAAARGLAARAGFLAPATPAFAAACPLGAWLRAGGIHRDVAPDQVIEVFSQVVTSLPHLSGPVRHLLLQRLQAAGGITWAPVGRGLALPHPSTRIALGREGGVVALLFLRDPLILPDPPPDGVPLRCLLFFLAPSPRAHLELLGLLSRRLARGPWGALLDRVAPDEEILAAADQPEPAAEGVRTAAGPGGGVA